jgi:hypothetical protein
MEILDNINSLFGDSLKHALASGSKPKIAASSFSIYAYEALKTELGRIDSLEFIFTSPTFIPDEATDKVRREKREFHIPKVERERILSGGEFEIRLKNRVTQRAIARECSEWMRRKARFRSNRTLAPMQQFACVDGPFGQAAYQPLHGFTAIDLGYQKGNAVSNLVQKMDEAPATKIFLNLFDQIWNSPQQVEDVTERLCEHIASVYQENPPERIYFLMLFHIFNEFLEDLSEDVLPNDRTGYLDTLIWKQLYNFQRDAATGVINKLETYNGCILADSVGLGKTFIGAMESGHKRFEKGLFITTGNFATEGEKIGNANNKLELIDGEKLVRMFEQAELGLVAKTVYEVDMKYFSDFLDTKETAASK